MKTAQDALIQHVEAADLGFAVVKPYAGEVAAAKTNPAALTQVVPAALVLYRSGALAEARGRYLFDVLVAVQTRALDVQASAAEGLTLAEALVRHLHRSAYWTGGSYAYVLDDTPELSAETLMVTPDFALLRVGVPVVERQS